MSNAAYAREFANWVRAAVARRDMESLVAYRNRAPHAKRAHPTDEHYLPLLVALGTSAEDDAPHWIEGGITDGVLSMDSFAWGLPVGEAAVA